MNDKISAEDEAGERVQAAQEKVRTSADQRDGKIGCGGGGGHGLSNPFDGAGQAKSL
jgi:hypothetical protein